MTTPRRNDVAAIPRRTYGICDVFDERALFDFIVWNAPDHEYSRRALRAKLEELIEEAITMLGGDEARL